MRKAYVHVGMPKCGSTTIQNSLTAGRDTLASRGLLWPSEDHSLLTGLFHQAGPRATRYPRKDFPDPEATIRTAEESFLREVRPHRGDLVLSSEYLHNLSRPAIEGMEKYLGRLGFRMVAIMYVRHPVAQATSQLTQGVKFNHRSLAEFYERPEYFCLRKDLTPFHNVLGDRLIVRDFAQAVREGLVEDFLGVIGAAGLEIPEQRANESLSMTATLLLDRLNGREKRGRVGQFFKIGGPPFRLPEHVADAIDKESAPAAQWARDTFGVALEPPRRAPPEPFTDKALSDVAELIARLK